MPFALKTHKWATARNFTYSPKKPKDIAIEPRLGTVDRIRPTDAGKGADLLEDRISARRDHRNVFRALGLDVYAVSREAVQTIVRSGRHVNPGDLVTSRGIGDDHTGVCE